jgi:hypothetical protein
MGRVVIVAMRPKAGCEAKLRNLVAGHVEILRQQGLATEREPVILAAGDGTVIEVFEWKSGAAIEAAHQNPAVLSLWERFAEVCEFIPVGDVHESAQLFSEFEPLD